MGSFVSVNVTDNKGEQLENYLRAIGETDTPLDAPNDAYRCSGCGGDNLCTDTAICTHVCMDCGVSNAYIDTSTMGVCYEQRVDIESQSTFVYKKENHFFEWLAQIQSKENTEVPQHVYDQVLGEIRKQRATAAAVTTAQTRKYLKKLQLNKFYEQAPAIACRISGRQPMRFSVELQETLVVMFKEIQAPWKRWVGVVTPGRKNFLSYSYVLYKFCELLEKDEYLESFSLLKSRQKLYQHDCLWQKMCTDLNWQFIPSI
jgi:hypothetical protein